MYASTIWKCDWFSFGRSYFRLFCYLHILSDCSFAFILVLMSFFFVIVDSFGLKLFQYIAEFEFSKKFRFPIVAVSKSYHFF